MLEPRAVAPGSSSQDQKTAISYVGRSNLVAIARDSDIKWYA